MLTILLQIIITGFTLYMVAGAIVLMHDSYIKMKG
jgi:hypothetical protein